MFRTLVSRQAQHAIDMDAASLVKPAYISHAPNITEEAEHVPPAGVLLWNESWYFDATSLDGSLGMYARIGRLPNQNRCNFVSGIFRKDQAPILLVDMDAPLPESDPLVQKFRTEKFSVESTCLDPLSTFAVKISGTGVSLHDPSAPLRGECGEDVPGISIDLVWNTNGQQYKKRAQSRYEVPCLVDGAIKIGDETLQIQSFLGQRNHSWGPRDWWVSDWVWSGLHFEDGTQIFTIALNRGSESVGGSGYIQKGEKLTEITNVVNEFEWETNGLPGNLQLHISPGDLTIQCQPVSAAGPRLLDPEGREAHLPRVMCTAMMRNGVRGVGWLDFNRVVKHDPERPSAKRQREA